MTKSVTRGEFYTAIDRLDARIDQCATKVDLDLAVGALVARMDDQAIRLRTDLRADLRADMQVMREELRADIRADLNVDLARHVRSIMERFTGQISTVDDKYADLPGRVSRLEARTTPAGRRR